MPYFLSLQYSAIQKTVMRHNRLWSIAGISQELSMLNEVILPNIAHQYHGKVMVAGGGKFTAYFDNWNDAEDAKEAIQKSLSTALPMLEFQLSDIVEAESFHDAKENKGIIQMLSDMKAHFRGYGVSYLPHLQVCKECGEYPLETDVCRICKKAKSVAKINFEKLESKTSLEKVYSEYLKKVKLACFRSSVSNFEDLFPKSNDDQVQRMAVWFSDLNNMNHKVPIWLNQPDDEVFDIFNQVKQVNIEVISNALADTFSEAVLNNWKTETLPFRLIVAGGDDLCIVMPEDFILDFVYNMDKAIRNKIKELGSIQNSNPLSTQWLREHAQKDRNNMEIGSYSFGASFVIASIHTPFKRIYDFGESLMKDAKQKTNRKGNSINWRILAEDDSQSDKLLEFERPLFISSDDNKQNSINCLSFEDYMHLRDKYKKISNSHRFFILDKLIELRQSNREDDFENFLKCFDSGERDKDFAEIIVDPMFRDDENRFIPARLTTLFELLSIKGGALK